MTLSDGNIFDDTEHHAATELLNSHFTSAKHLLKLFLSIEVIKKLESARTPASLAATDAGTRSAHW